MTPDSFPSDRDPALGLPNDLPSDVMGRIPLFAELQKVLSWSGGPVNWDLARQIAVAAAASGEETHAVDAATASECAEDGRIAELWLSQATPLEIQPATLEAITPAQWAERACDAYRELVDPLAAKISGSIAQQAPDAFGGALPAGIDASVVGQAMAQMGPLLLGVQTGGIIGGVAKQLLGMHDLPVPAAEASAAAVVVPGVDALARDWSLDVKEARLWVALHETAHRAMQQSLPALRSGFFAAFLGFVSSLTIDFSTAFERLQGIDWTDPTRIEDSASAGGFFDMLADPGTTAESARLEHLVALAEATADRAVEAAADGRLPSASRISEAAARHHTSGEDGVAALARFIGIGSATFDESRRATGEFTRTILAGGGWPALLRMWEDAETIPSREELARPEQWLERIQ